MFNRLFYFTETIKIKNNEVPKLQVNAINNNMKKRIIIGSVRSLQTFYFFKIFERNT